MKYKVWDKVNEVFCDDITVEQDGSLVCDYGSTLFIRDDFQVIWEAEESDALDIPYKLIIDGLIRLREKYDIALLDRVDINNKT